MLRTRVPSDLVWPRWLAALKISRPPFWIYWSTVVAFGYLGSADATGRHGDLALFVLVIAGVCLAEAATCLHNELVDTEEDRANQPNRASLVRSLGETTLRRLVVACYAVCFASLVPLAILGGRTRAVLALVALAAAVTYDAGPRFKRRPPLAEVAIACAAFAAYMLGWAWNASVRPVPAMAFVVAFFMGAGAFMKDLPDVAGDEQVGASAVFSIRNAAVRRALLVAIFAAPYVLVAALVLRGDLPSRMALLLALVPLGLAMLAVAERARSLHTMIVAYELAWLYAHAFLVVVFVLYTPTAPALAVGLTLFAGRNLLLALGLAPRLVEPDFRWRTSVRALARGE